MPFEPLIGEEAVLTLLTVERRPVVDHLRVNLQTKSPSVPPSNPPPSPPTYFDLVNPLHVVTQLVQILDVAIANLADDKLWLATARIWTLAWLDPSLLLLSWQGRDGNARS
jgi:hypothetical protein